MVKVIKIDGGNNYFVNENGEKVLKFSEGLKLNCVLEDESILEVSSEKIQSGYGGQICFDYKDDHYIIDDLYQNTLIRSGYIIINNYDTEQIESKPAGLDVRKKLFNYVNEIISKQFDYCKNMEIDVKPQQQIKCEFEKDGFLFTVVIDTINSIVNKNQQRKIAKLPFYPFIKEMDKYGTLYLSIFCKKLDEVEDITIKYNDADNFISEFINILDEYSDNKFRYERCVLTKRINYWEGI